MDKNDEKYEAENEVTFLLPLDSAGPLPAPRSSPPTIYCHQCRQGKIHFISACRNARKNKPCGLKYCHRCLLNRYGEKGDEVDLLGDWQCPKCRGICNCSQCMKKKGQQPTGILVHKAKGKGFSSVSQYLLVQGSEEVHASPQICTGSESRQNICRTENADESSVQDESESSQSDDSAEREEQEYKNVGIPLPEGIDLKTVAGVDIPAEDVGHALQFLEFCNAFGEVLDLDKGNAESILQEVMNGCRRGRGEYSLFNQLQSLLLSFKQNVDVEGYNNLSPSQRLRFLNFLCDEALGTRELRKQIRKEKVKFTEREMDAQGKYNAVIEKEELKRKMCDEVANGSLSESGVPLTISEHAKLVSTMKVEVRKAHAETLKVKCLPPKKNQRSDAVRTEPILFEGNGHVFWRLTGYSSEPNILLQDIGSGDSQHEEKWFSYDDEKRKAVEDYISSKRKKSHNKMQSVHDEEQGRFTKREKDAKGKYKAKKEKEKELKRKMRDEVANAADNLCFLNTGHFVQLPQLEIPSLPLTKRPSLVSESSEDDHPHLNHYHQEQITRSSAGCSNNNINVEKVTDWRTLDKFVASQLSQEDIYDGEGISSFGVDHHQLINNSGRE